MEHPHQRAVACLLPLRGRGGAECRDRPFSLIDWETSMVIKRSELDSIDFSDIDTGERVAPVHPGEILRSEFLDPLGMSVNALAKALHVPTPRINDIMLGKRAISADTA